MYIHVSSFQLGIQTPPPPRYRVCVHTLHKYMYIQGREEGWHTLCDVSLLCNEGNDIHNYIIVDVHCMHIHVP